MMQSLVELSLLSKGKEQEYQAGICQSAESSCQRAFRQEDNSKCENIGCKTVSYQATTRR